MSSLSWERAMHLARTDRDQLADALRNHDPVDVAIREAGHLTTARTRPQHRRTVEPVRRGDGRFHWDIKDHATSPHPVLASGRAFTRAGAWRQLERAYARVLEQAAAERVGLRDRRDDGLVP